MQRLQQTIERNYGWIAIAILTLLPIIRWFQINSLSLHLESSFQVFSMIGRLSALLGISLYAINFVLSTRLRFLESLFGGLNKVYIAHHVVGGIALVALLVHPLALAFRYIPDKMTKASELIIPSLSGPLDWPLAYGRVAFVGMVFLLVLTFFVKLPYQLWLFTHRFLGLAFLFGALHALQIDSDVSSDTWLKFYILALSLIGIAAFVYRSLLSRIYARGEEYTIEQISSPAKNVVSINLRPKTKAISYKPGQFVFAKFMQPGLDKEGSHPFTIASAPSTDGSIQLTIKALGDFTSKLGTLETGTTVELEGAFGRFASIRNKQPRQIWIAGGIGVTPFISMAKAASKKQDKTLEQINMFYVAKSKEELIDEETFIGLANMQNSNFNYHTHLDTDGTRINAEHIKNVVKSLNSTAIFICGPPAMMRDLKKQFIDHGVSKHNIHTEEFSIS